MIKKKKKVKVLYFIEFKHTSARDARSARLSHTDGNLMIKFMENRFLKSLINQLIYIFFFKTIYNRTL